MKRELLIGLVIILAVFAIKANAGVFATAEGDGARVLLLSEPCKEGGNMVLAHNPDGLSVSGCWTTVDGDPGAIWVRYEDGKLRRYPFEVFTPTDQAKPEREG